jgi:hypothetical protein
MDIRKHCSKCELSILKHYKHTSYIFVIYGELCSGIRTQNVVFSIGKYAVSTIYIKNALEPWVN